MAIRVVPLGSGSRGNATLVEFDDEKILIDAGLSARDLCRRLESVGVDPSTIGLVLLTHEHRDHTRGVERFSTKMRVPVACSRATLAAMNLSPIHLHAWSPLATGTQATFGAVTVDPFRVPHDAADPVGFVLESGGARIGIATDLGHATTLVTERLRGCHVILIESNHDVAMLRNGPYPWHLKQRVSGRLGHLSNHEAAEMLRATAGSDCRAVILGHLSEKNNTHTLAREAASQALAEAGQRRVEMRIARQRFPSPQVVL